MIIESVTTDRAIRYSMAATAQEVFDAWVTPEIVEQWWGPDGFSAKVHELDLTEGGRFAFEMIEPGGKSCFMTGIYTQIHAPNLLVFEVFDHCNLNLPDEVIPQAETSTVTVTITEQGAATEVVLTHDSLNATYSPLASGSWLQSLIKLAALEKPLLRQNL